MRLWNSDLLHLILAISLAAILSRFIGFFLYFLLLICLVYILRQAFLLNQLKKWLRSGEKPAHPPSSGQWKEIYSLIFRLKKAEKKRKKKLRRIIEQFRKSTAALPDAIVVLGDHDKISWFNDTAGQILGLKKSDVGQRLPNLIRTPAFRAFLSRKNATEIFSMKSPEDERLIMQVKIVRYEKNAHLLVAHDITFLKNTERMRKNFVDNISHELRTPLTVLKGYLETLIDMDDSHSALLSHSLEQMNEQTLRMQQLVNDFAEKTGIGMIPQQEYGYSETSTHYFPVSSKNEKTSTKIGVPTIMIEALIGVVRLSPSKNMI